jgi:predicted metalloendopeptidase
MSLLDATLERRPDTFADDQEATIRNPVSRRRVPAIMVLLTLSFSPFSVVELHAQAPGDDFFAYANREWLNTVVLPTGKDRWTVRDDISERTRRQIAAILDDAKLARPGSLARKVADFRSAYLNEAAMEARGISALAPTFARIDRVTDKAALARLLGSSMRADVDPLNFGVYASSSVLGLAVEHSIHGERTYTPFLLQGGLGLGDRDQYLSTDGDAVRRRARYQRYVMRMLGLAGFDHSDKRAEHVLALETALAEAHATSQASAVDRNADHRWTRADFAREAPGMDWSAFLDAAGLDKQIVVVAWQPSAVKGVAALVGSKPIEVWKDYLRFHTIDEYADVLPRTFADAAAEMRGDKRTRDERALAVTQSAMAGAIGDLYAKRYFSATQKVRVRRIIADVTAAFREHVSRASWLSPQSRTTALAKIDALYVGIGYPERWEDWTDLRIDPGDALGNARRVAERSYRHALARLTQPFDRHEWLMAPQTVGALLNFQQNAYTFSAALLQPPKYDSTASDAAMYGAIGAVIGHDVSHFVDVLGAEYEPDGRLHRWWTAADSAKFEAAADPLVRQFAAYEALPGVHVDGRLTRTENVADLAGLTAAFEAHRKALGTRIADRAYVKDADREFFVAFAQAFGTKMNEAGLRAQLATDHAPEMYRFNTVRNLDAWYEAFDVVPGQRLYLEPSARVKIW